MASAIPKRPNDRGIEKPTHATRLEFYYIHMVVHKYTIPIHRVPYCHYSTVRYAWSISNFKAILVQPAGTLVSNLCRYISNIWSKSWNTWFLLCTKYTAWLLKEPRVYLLWTWLCHMKPKKSYKIVTHASLKNKNQQTYLNSSIITFTSAPKTGTNLIMEWYVFQSAPYSWKYLMGANYRKVDQTCVLALLST